MGVMCIELLISGLKLFVYKTTIYVLYVVRILGAAALAYGSISVLTFLW